MHAVSSPCHRGRMPIIVLFEPEESSTASIHCVLPNIAEMMLQICKRIQVLVAIATPQGGNHLCGEPVTSTQYTCLLQRRQGQISY